MNDPSETTTTGAEPSAEAAAAPSLLEVIDVVQPHLEKIEEGVKAIVLTLDALAEHLRTGGRPAEALGEQPAPAPTPTRPEPAAEAPAAEEPGQTAPQPAPAVPVAAPAPAPEPAAPPVAIQVQGDGGNWSQIVFGQHLAVDPSVSTLSGALLADVYAGDNEAIGLMGHLMQFRAATAERKPKMLKDIGEAFYRWKPNDDAPLRDALVTWLHAELDSVAIGNRIAIVQVGDRYDMQRHNAKERGVEIKEVYGWVVLRENGKVYSKANVAVQ